MKKLLYILLICLCYYASAQNYYSLNLDADDNVFFNNFNLDDKSFTIQIWFKTDFSNGDIFRNTFIDENSDANGYYLRFEGNGQLHFDLNNLGAPILWPSGGNIIYLQTDESFNDNKWHMASVVFDNQEKKCYLYVDGVNHSSQELQNISISSSYNNAALNVGSSGFSGFIDEFAFWHKALSESEILSSFSCVQTLQEEALVGYWNFNDDSGNTVYDLSVNGNHGTIYGTTYSDDVPENTCIGCKNPDAINYNENASEEDEQLCIYSQDYVHGLWNEVDDGAIEYEYLQEEYDALNTNSTNSTSSLQQALDTWNTTIDLSAGWNMFGYGCPESIDLVQGLSNHTDFISIVKDNNGAVYIPEFGFNGIGDLTPGFGYQIKLTEAIEGFSLCDWYVNDIPEDNIVSLQEENDALQAFVDSINAPGCMDTLACNFDITNLYDDGSCDFPEQGYDCNGNLIAEIGDEFQGGILFYIDETGQHGLVAAMEDLTEGAQDLYNYGYSGYTWGCFDEFENANGVEIGTGFQNTYEMMWSCSTNANQHLRAGNVVWQMELNGYDDWFMPSRDELIEIYNSIGGSEYNFDDAFYWSSTEYNDHSAIAVYFVNGIFDSYAKYITYKVRPIRSF